MEFQNTKKNITVILSEEIVQNYNYDQKYILTSSRISMRQRSKVRSVIKEESQHLLLLFIYAYKPIQSHEQIHHTHRKLLLHILVQRYIYSYYLICPEYLKNSYHSSKHKI